MWWFSSSSTCTNYGEEEAKEEKAGVPMDLPPQDTFRSAQNALHETGQGPGHNPAREATLVAPGNSNRTLNGLGVSTEGDTIGYYQK